MGYTKSTIKGILWMGSLRSITRLIAFLKIAILARILGPKEFGIFGIASLALAFLEILTDTGINVFLIQEKANVKKYLDSAWIVSIARGILITIILVIFAKIISSFFNEPNSYKLILLISSIPFLRGFINPSIVNLQKELWFNKEFWLRSNIFILDGLVTLISAFILKSAESLVLGMLAGTILELIWSWMFIKPRPRFKIEPIKLKIIIHRGKWVTLASIFEYLFQHLDDIVVGKFMGSGSLGFYQVAYKISTLPISEGGEIVSKVVFPVYSKISDDLERLKKAYFKVVFFVSLPTVVFGLFLILFARPFTFLILGTKWVDVVPVIRVLSLFGILRAISGTSSVLFLSLKKQGYVTLVTFVSTLGLFLAILPMVIKFGLIGAGVSCLIGSLVALPLIFYFLRKELYEKSGS